MRTVVSGNEGKKWLGRKMCDLSGVMIKFYILLRFLITWVYTLSKLSEYTFRFVCVFYIKRKISSTKMLGEHTVL